MSYWQESSLLAAPQVSGFGTPATSDSDFAALLCEKPNVQFSTDITELELLTGQVGAAPERLVGRRYGTIGFKIPLQSLKAGYDPTAEDPGGSGVIPPWLAMLGNSIGSAISGSVNTAAKFWDGLHLSHSQYTAGGVASATSTAVTLDDATASNKVDVGQLIATAASASTSTIQFGFAKTKASQVITLFEASGQTVNSATANCYGTANAWISSAHSSQFPMTFRWLSEQTEGCYILSDAICTGWTLTWDSGEVPTIEFQFSFYNFSVDKTKGGLEVPDSFYRVPQIVGSSNGRATVAGSAQCGLSSCSIAYSCEVHEIKCHGATQGISAVTYKKPRVKVACQIPWSSSDAVYDSAGSSGNTGSHLWQSALELGTTKSIGVYVGSVIGKCFAFLVPSGSIVAVPQVVDLDGAVGYSLEIEAGAYTGDSTDTAETAADSPLDSLFRLSVC